jgi:transcriptional activator HAC1
MADTMNPLDTLPTSPDREIYTVSPADTSLETPDPEDDMIKEEDDEEILENEKKPAKKRKSWGQELPTPKTNLPPRYVDDANNPNALTSANATSANAPRQMMKRNSVG